MTDKWLIMKKDTVSHHITDLSVLELREKLNNCELTAQEAVNAFLTQINSIEKNIGAFLFINDGGALERACELDKTGPDRDKPLWGVPIAIKDNISVKNHPTTAASRILENYVPFYDSHVIRRLKDAGAIILGKTNMDEFAMGSSSETSAFKSTKNPWNTLKVPGGSSGGSAAAVSARECAAAIGSDTGGSIRQPAAFCGCVGLKPTYGRVSRYGLLAYGSSLDQIGPLARTVADCGLILNCIAGWDNRDNTCSQLPVEDYIPDISEMAGSLKNYRIGFAENCLGEGLDQDTLSSITNAVEDISFAGAKLIHIDLPDTNVAIAAYYIIAMAEASSNLARYDGVRYGRRANGVTNLDELYKWSRSQGFGPEVKRRIMLGSYILSAGYYEAYFRKAAQTRRLIQESFLAQLQKCDAILMPVSPVVPWDIGHNIDDPLKNYLMDAFTVPVNLAGLPAISIPVSLGRQTGLPVGIQLIGAPFSEKKLLEIAAHMENIFGRLPIPPGA